MNRHWGIGFLIVSFSLSSVNVSLASQVVDISPVYVQPYPLNDINQQMMAQDRINRDQELAIRGLIDENQKLTNTASAQNHDATLEKINQTLNKYNTYLVARDQARIMANNYNESKYHDLIKLTVDVDDMKGVGQDLALKRDVIEDKYKILNELKNEMMALNEKLKGEVIHPSNSKITVQQADKIQMLTQRLAEMDQKIARYDELLARKDREIFELNNKLDNLRNISANKDEMIQELKEQIKSQGGKIPAIPEPIKQKNRTSGTIDLPPVIVQQGSVNNSQSGLMELKNKIQEQSLALQSKDDSIRWLNQVLAVTQKKAEYLQLTSQQDRLALKQIKDNQVDLLKSELENKITESNDQAQKIALLEQSQAKDDRLSLAKQLINLQQQEASLLDEKAKLVIKENNIMGGHVGAFEDKVRVLIAKHQTSDIDLKDRVRTLENELSIKQRELNLFKSQLVDKIANEKNQDRLQEQIGDLNDQLKEKENQITTMKEEIRTGQRSEIQAEDLKGQLSDQENIVSELKKELDFKNAQLDRTNAMISGYQKKLESKDDAYNKQLAQILAVKSDQAQIQSKLEGLSSQLQDKDKDIQTRDLSLSMIDQRITEDKDEIKDLKAQLAATRAELGGMPSSDEIEFLRAGYKKATGQLKQKDDMLLQIKANVLEYQKEFKEQLDQFKSLKEQLQDANEDINRKNEDLKYKDLELIRLKERSVVKEGDLKDQIRILTQKLELAQNNKLGKTHEKTTDNLSQQLIAAKQKIKDLEFQLDRLRYLTKNDRVGEKLKQALDKIDEQGRMINVLTQKLQDQGKSADLRS